MYVARCSVDGLISVNVRGNQHHLIPVAQAHHTVGPFERAPPMREIVTSIIGHKLFELHDPIMAQCQPQCGLCSAPCTHMIPQCNIQQVSDTEFTFHVFFCPTCAEHEDMTQDAVLRLKEELNNTMPSSPTTRAGTRPDTTTAEKHRNRTRRARTQVDQAAAQRCGQVFAAALDSVD